ncbi:MAG: Hsp20/alpha crystallin family protein [Burkholderiaceae bacterium]|nr:Hsp20/alpha crystallin family protein [Burkholderiaceae bacterium]
MTFRKPIDSTWANAINMLEQADRLHRQFFRLSGGRSSGPTWEPPVDIFETGRNLSVLVALPGVASDQVKVVIDGNALVILGQRPIPAPVSAQIRRMEIPYGRFERRIELPPGHFEIQESTLTNGCLLLSLLKRA